MTSTLPLTARPTTAAPWFGRPWEHRHAEVAGFGSLAAGGVYWVATRIFAPELTPGIVEFAGTVTSLWSVWITQRRNVLAMPVGIVSVVLMGIFFARIDLVGQSILHFGYYLPIQFWAWARWCRGGPQDTELTVRRLPPAARLGWGVALVAGTLVFGSLLDAGWDNAVLVYWDASVVAASVVAMLLLSDKRVESWWLWIGPVNVSAIALYLATGATMFAALYVAFLVMAVVGLERWRRAADANLA